MYEGIFGMIIYVIFCYYYLIENVVIGIREISIIWSLKIIVNCDFINDVDIYCIGNLFSCID